LFQIFENGFVFGNQMQNIFLFDLLLTLALLLPFFMIELVDLIIFNQDSMAPHVQEILNFKCVKSIRTVYSLLEERNALNVLSDQYIALATKEIIADGRSL
jgi:hypothetical protein